MHVRASAQQATACDGDVLVLPVYTGGELPAVTADAARVSGLDLGAVARRFRLRAAGDRCWIPVPPGGELGCEDIMLVCAGARAGGAGGGVSADSLRTAAMLSARHAGRATVVSALAGVPVAGRDAAEIAAEGAMLGAYRFDRYRSPDRDTREPGVEVVVLPGASEQSVQAGQAIGAATNLARDLTNTAPGDLTPQAFAGICADQASRLGLSFRALELDELRARGFGGIAGVGAGSPNPPVLVCLSTPGAGDPADTAGDPGPTALVGKGITFDSGGLDLKDLSWMLQMKDDMAGAAAILGALIALQPLGLRPRVRAYLALAENAVSGQATRPGDVLRHYDGRTTEVVSPDAEGRLVLADAISYAREQAAARIIDVATLTGSTGLGPDLWGIIGNSQPLLDALLTAGGRAGEPGWQLPLWEGYRRKLRSDIADIRNLQLGEQWPHGAVWGAMYLSEFAGDCDWAHLDTGATVFRAEADDTWIAGGTGSGTRTLIEYLRAADSGAAGR
ncbi:MAG TPA: leucyl aminopeptidase family protein [Streptosporangiaceae bacterium]